MKRLVRKMAVNLEDQKVILNVNLTKAQNK